MEMIEWVKLLIGSGITGTALLFVVIIFLFMNPDKFEHWMAIFDRIFYRASSSFPRIRRKFDRRVVASSIQDSVNGICGEINKQAPDILPHALKIEWVQSESPDVFIKDGKAVVRLKHYVNQDRNIVDATLMYLNKGLLPIANVYLDETLQKSCEYEVAKLVFAARRDTGAFAYFIENELNPTINSDVDFKHDLDMLEDLDYVGFFTRVFLTEVKQTGEKVLKSRPTPAIKQELRNFAEFLQIIATKGPTEDVPLAFNGVRVKVAVVLVAKKETIQSYGKAAYIRRISRIVREGYETIYVTGWGEEFVKMIEEIMNDLKGKIVTILRPPYYYRIPLRKQKKAILLVCQPNLSYLAQQRELQEEVKQAMAENIPKIKNGEVEIVSIARIKGAGCKIAVRMASGEDVSKATGACIGKNGERVNALRTYLPHESVSIIPWSDDVKEYIVNALSPLKGSHVESVELDEENHIAKVEVSNDEAYTKALGRDNYNVKLARELTGWLINIKGLSRSENMPTPDDELGKLISAHVPEIKNNEIELVRLARIKGIGSKVIVKWSDKDVNVSFMASLACRGRDSAHLKMIQQEISGEWLNFHEWCDDPKELIIRCLYPLKRSDVASIDLNYEKNTAIITIRDVEESPLLWRNQYNLTLAEKVTGWSIEISEKT
jgi:transcription antitermination factor NusA-like protein